MVEPDQVKALALALPGVTDESEPGRMVFFADGRGIAWTFKRRVHPRKPKVPDPEILAVRCPIERKELLVEVAPDIYFDDDHYRGFPAVMVRLAAIEPDDLSALLAAAAAASVSGPKWSRKAKPRASQDER